MDIFVEEYILAMIGHRSTPRAATYSLSLMRTNEKAYELLLSFREVRVRLPDKK